VSAKPKQRPTGGENLAQRRDEACGKILMIKTKRVYEPAASTDGARFLVDHLWPRGLKKEAVKIEGWNKAVAPSNELRQWFGHEPAKWKEFQRRYLAELKEKPEAWQPLLQAAQAGDITLVFSARDTEHNNAVALKSYLEKKLKAGARSRGPARASRSGLRTLPLPIAGSATRE
jgi:uncharacterized protein YeaO (DUF488 family)